MNTFNNQFIEILADNEYQEILDGDVNKPEVMHYYELNGNSSPKELKKYLERHFQKFKREYLAVEPDREDDLYSNMLASLNRILANFTPAYKEVMHSNNSSLKELFNVKRIVLINLDEFISSNPNSEENSSKDIIYYFTVKGEFEDMYDIHLNRLYDGLNNLQFINCTPVQFKELFRPYGKTRRKTPEPIIWMSGSYAHLAYFIKCLVEADFIPNTKQPSFNQIAKKLFYDSEQGNFFETLSDKSDVKNRNKSPYLEIKSMVQSKLKKN